MDKIPKALLFARIIVGCGIITAALAFAVVILTTHLNTDNTAAIVIWKLKALVFPIFMLVIGILFWLPIADKVFLPNSPQA